MLKTLIFLSLRSVLIRTLTLKEQNIIPLTYLSNI